MSRVKKWEYFERRNMEVQVQGLLFSTLISSRFDFYTYKIVILLWQKTQRDGSYHKD